MNLFGCPHKIGAEKYELDNERKLLLRIMNQVFWQRVTVFDTVTLFYGGVNKKLSGYYPESFGEPARRCFRLH